MKTDRSDLVCNLKKSSAHPGAGGGFVACAVDTVHALPLDSIQTTFANESLDVLGAVTMSCTSLNQCNQQYSVTAVTTSAGAVAERYAYTAYGQPTILNASASPIASSAINNRYMFTGREWDATLGLYHYRARWMNGLAGRFLGRDPIGYLAGPNIYAYVLSNPCRWVDPFGLKCRASILMGHYANVMANIQIAKPNECDRIGAVCCFMDKTMKACEEEFGEQISIPNWPTYNGLIYDHDLPMIFRDIWDGVKLSLDGMCDDCECKTVSVTHYCDDDIEKGMQSQVDAGRMQTNWCNVRIVRDCKTGAISYVSHSRRLPNQPIREREGRE